MRTASKNNILINKNIISKKEINFLLNHIKESSEKINIFPDR